jgi:hypothetical protein
VGVLYSTWPLLIMRRDTLADIGKTQLFRTGILTTCGPIKVELWLKIAFNCGDAWFKSISRPTMCCGSNLSVANPATGPAMTSPITNQITFEARKVARLAVRRPLIFDEACGFFRQSL